MKIRKATVWDALHITGMWHKMMVELDNHEGELNTEQFYIDLIVKTKNPNYAIFVIPDDAHTPVGFIMGSLMHDDYEKGLAGFCEYMYVEKEHRGKGYLKQLVDLMHGFFKMSKVKTEKFITKYDDKLIAIWTRKGYKPCQVVYREEV